MGYQISVHPCQISPSRVHFRTIRISSFRHRKLRTNRYIVRSLYRRSCAKGSLQRTRQNHSVLSPFWPIHTGPAKNRYNRSNRFFEHWYILIRSTPILVYRLTDMFNLGITQVVWIKYMICSHNRVSWTRLLKV